MKHSIISWDSTFRNFFHLIDALVNQEYCKDDYELIYIEQRTREHADQYNHTIGLKSLYDKYLEVKEKINIRVEYLNSPLDQPYHLGKCNNAGIRLAKGEYISIMDGDLLLPNDFLKSLDKLYNNKPNAIINLHRFMCPTPLGVSFENWKNAKIDFEECLSLCGNFELPLKSNTPNKGPLISANKKYWTLINGYDENILWSTSASALGIDVNNRLEIAAKTASEALQNSYCVHPWHPIGYAAKTRPTKKSKTKEYIGIQLSLTELSKKMRDYDWRKRELETNKIERQHSNLIKYIIKQEILNDNKNYHFTIYGYSLKDKLLNLVNYLRYGIRNRISKL